MTTERIMLVLLLVGVAYGCGIVLWPFLSAIVWAGILTFTTWPLYTRLRRHLPPAVAALFMMVGSALVIVLPLTLLTSMGIADLPLLVDGLDKEIESLAHTHRAPQWLISLPIVGKQLTSTYLLWSRDVSTLGEALHPYAGQIARHAVKTLVQMTSGVAELIMALFVAFFFWTNGSALGQIIRAILERITGDYAGRLIAIIGNVIRGTVYGILGTAIVQGVLTSLGLFISGVPAPVLLGGVTAFVAVFPVGAPLVWVPASLWLVVNHRIGWGLFLAAYGILFISGADHIIRPAFIARARQR